jgi:hypothetical protein
MKFNHKALLLPKNETLATKKSNSQSFIYCLKLIDLQQKIQFYTVCKKYNNKKKLPIS